MNALPLIVGGGALGAMLLLERKGRSAGKANAAAAAALAAGDIGVEFVAPENGSMVAAHDAMARAIASSDTSPFLAGRVGRLWIEAYQAGAKVDPANYALAAYDNLTQAAPYTGLPSIGSMTDLRICDGGLFSPNTALGKAVCKVRNLSIAELGAMLDATRELAREMDNADYRIAGTRRSDRIAIPSITTLPERALSAAADAATGLVGSAAAGILFSPVGAAAILGIVAWRVLR